jgi:hypothetical protein
LSKKKQAEHEERRKDQVEINLLAGTEHWSPLAKARRGCSLPFFGGSLLLIAVALGHSILG